MARLVRIPLFMSVAARWLSHEPRARTGARLALATVALWARGRGLPLGGRPFVVTATTANGTPVRFRVWDYIDMLVAREIFLDRDYRVPEDLEPATIADLGANVGIAVRFLAAQYPAAEIVAAEPDPRNAARLRANVAGLGRVRVVEAAVAPEHGRAAFSLAAEGWASALGDENEDPHIEVDCVTLDELLDGEAVDLLKLDIEGGEWPLLEAGALQATSDCIVGEAHFDERHDEGALRAQLTGFDVTIHRAGDDVASFTATRISSRPRG